LCGDFSIHNHTTLQAGIKHKAGRERREGKEREKRAHRDQGALVRKTDTIPFKVSTLRKKRKRKEKEISCACVLRQRDSGWSNGVRCALRKMRLDGSLLPDGLQERPEHSGNKVSATSGKNGFPALIRSCGDY